MRIPLVLPLGFTALALALWLGSAGHASAQASAPGRAEFDEAASQFEAGNHQLALDGFLRTREIMVEAGNENAPLLWFNIGRAQEELRRDDDALTSYERFLAEASEDAPYRRETRDRLRELRARLAAEGERGARTAPATGGGFTPSPLGLAIAAIGAASMIAGGVVGGVALAQDADGRSSCQDTRCTPEGYAAIVGANDIANVADGLLWGGLAVLATGLVLTFVFGETGDTTAGAACTGDGCVAALRGTF